MATVAMKRKVLYLELLCMLTTAPHTIADVAADLAKVLGQPVDGHQVQGAVKKARALGFLVCTRNDQGNGRKVWLAPEGLKVAQKAAESYWLDVYGD